jgi:hypothetical protein
MQSVYPKRSLFRAAPAADTLETESNHEQGKQSSKERSQETQAGQEDRKEIEAWSLE